MVDDEKAQQKNDVKRWGSFPPSTRDFYWEVNEELAYSLSRMLSETEGLSVCIDGSGTSSYCFQQVAAKASVAGLACLNTLPHGKGIGTTANTALPTSTSAYTEQTVALCVTGENAAYICKYCYAKIALKAKVRDDCPSLTFCSEDCLRQAGPYLDFCGFVGNEMNRKQWGDASALIQLAVHYGYSISIANTAHSLTRALQVLELESHSESISTTDTLNVAAQWLYTYFNENLSPSTITALSTRGFSLANASTGTALLYKLLRIIKYNAQAVPIHGVPKAQLLCLLPTVARLNHSCAPNCALLYDVYRSTVPSTHSEGDAESAYSLRLAVLSLRDILPGEELTMSYIQPLCGSADFRRTLLRQGFLFECQCARCSVPCVSKHLNEQCVVLEKKLQMTMQRAQSSQKAISYASLAELLTSAQSLLQQLSTSLSTEDVPIKSSLPVSEVHDAASFVLQQSLLTLKVASTGGAAAMDAMQQGKVLELTVRASLALSQCWALTGCANLLQRIEIVVSGSNYAVQLQKVENVMKTKFACIKQFKMELERVIQVLVTVYHCDHPGGLVESATESKVSIISSRTSLRVQRETSTLPYLCKLYRKAVKNGEQLK